MAPEHWLNIQLLQHLRQFGGLGAAGRGILRKPFDDSTQMYCIQYSKFQVCLSPWTMSTSCPRHAVDFSAPDIDLPRAILVTALKGGFVGLRCATTRSNLACVAKNPMQPVRRNQSDIHSQRSTEKNSASVKPHRGRLHNRARK